MLHVMQDPSVAVNTQPRAVGARPTALPVQGMSRLRDTRRRHTTSRIQAPLDCTRTAAPCLCRRG